MIELQIHAEGLVLPVRAQPGARRAGIVGRHAGALRVAVTEAAEKGKANKALAAVLCKALRLRKSQLELLRGETSRQKRFLVRGISREQLTERINNLLQKVGE